MRREHPSQQGYGPFSFQDTEPVSPPNTKSPFRAAARRDVPAPGRQLPAGASTTDRGANERWWLHNRPCRQLRRHRSADPSSLYPPAVIPTALQAGWRWPWLFRPLTPAVWFPGFSPGCFGEELHPQQLPDVSGLWFVEAVLWGDMLRAVGIGPAARTFGWPGGLRVNGVNSRRPGPACPTVTRSIKLIRAVMTRLTAVDGPRTPVIQGFCCASCAFLVGLRWGWGGCIVF